MRVWWAVEVDMPQDWDMADDDHDHTFESADAGASATYPMQAGTQTFAGAGIQQDLQVE